MQHSMECGLPKPKGTIKTGRMALLLDASELIYGISFRNHSKNIIIP